MKSTGRTATSPEALALQWDWERYKRHTERGKKADADRVAEKIIAACEPLIRSLLRNLELPRDLSRDHLENVGRLAVFAALQRYDVAFSPLFFGFVYLTVWGELRNALRAHQRHNFLGDAYAILDDDAIVEWQQESDNRVALDAVVSRLCPEQQQLIRLRFEKGYQFDEIGLLLGMGEKMVSRRVQAALEELRDITPASLATT